MIQGRGCLGFALEAGERLRVFGYIVGEKLESDKAAEFYVLSLVDDAHPATTEPLNDAVVRDGLVDHRKRRLREQLC